MMRRWLTALVVAGLAGAGVGAAAPAVSAASTTCLVVDTTSGQSYSGLQDAVNAAAAGDTLSVKGTCTGTTQIHKSLTITGHSNGGHKTATLNGGGASFAVLTIAFGITVTLNTLVITNGNNVLSGGGIRNDGTLTLNGSTVSNNSGSAGGGITNVVGTLTLNHSTVSNNTAAGEGGGIFDNAGTVTLNDSTVSNNTAGFSGGGFFFFPTGGTLNMTGSSAITGNHAGTALASGGGGICNEAGTASLNGAVAGTGGNVFDNTPDDISTVC